jgi:hypothetical protein
VEAVIRSRPRDEPDADWPGQLLDVWAAGEAAASLGFAAARLCDDIDNAVGDRGALERQAAVVCPAAKLFSTETTCAMLPKTPGLGRDFLRDKLIDAQLEAMYLGPEAIQRRQISAFMMEDVFDAQFAAWTGEMRELAGQAPCARTLAAAMEFWSWTLDRLRGTPIFREAHQSAAFAMADALCELLAARALILDVLTRGSFHLDLGMVQSVRAGGRVAQICSGLLLGQDPKGKTFAALRAKVYASFSGLAPARNRALEFIRKSEDSVLEAL